MAQDRKHSPTCQSDSESKLLEEWSAQPVAELFSREMQTRRKGHTYRLKSPAPGDLVSVLFTNFPDHPDQVIVGSCNRYGAAHEPRGVYSVADARVFWRRLKVAGFTQERI